MDKLLYSKCQVGHCNGCVKFEFNDTQYKKYDSYQRGQSAYITKYISYVFWYFY
jgi:hypothetical protein